MNLLLFLSTALAGDTIHEVELAVGADMVTRTERALSPLPLDGLSPSVTLGWSPRGQRDANVLRASFTPATLRAPGAAWTFTREGEAVQTGPSSAAMVDVQYAYGRRIDGDGWTLHLGGTSANHLENIATSFAFGGIETYFGALELGPWVDWRVRLGERQALELEGWVPLVSWIARNPYSVHDGEHIWNTRDNKPVRILFRYIADGQPYTVNAYQAVHLRAAYSVALSKRLTLFARGRADGFHHTVPRPLAEWQLGLDLGLRGTF